MKPHIQYLLLFCIVAVMPVLAADNIAFYMQRLSSHDIDNDAKLQCIDSLIALNAPESDSLLFLRLDIAVETGRHDMAINTYNRLRSAKNTISVDKDCKLRLDYIRALSSAKCYDECLNQCIELLELSKPDSLIYYNAYANEMLDEFTRHMKMELGVDYISETANLLEYAQRRQLPGDVVGKIKKTLLSQKLMKTLYEADYENALKEVTALMKMPASKIEQAQLDAKVAFIYMQIDKPDLAEKYYQQLLSDSDVLFPHAVALMNYMHLLNSQGRHADALEAFRSHKKAASLFNGDLYQTYLMSNKAIAEFSTDQQKQGFDDMVRAKEMTDSLFLESKYHNGLLAHRLFKKDKEIEATRPRIRMLHKWLIATGAIIALLAVALAAAIAKWRRTCRERGDIAAELDRVASIYEESICRKESKERADNGKMAAQILQLGAIQESFSSIEAALANKRKSPDEKLEMIVGIMENSKKNTSARDLFEHHFEQAHAPFFKNLYAAHPDLSPSEARMCAYLIMNLSSKEIASLSNKTIRSVESTRYRLSKKFDLPEGQSVVTYLRQFIK